MAGSQFAATAAGGLHRRGQSSLSTGTFVKRPQARARFACHNWHWRWTPRQMQVASNRHQADGVGRAPPWSGTGLAVGAVTMAGLPPGVVFVSQWFVLETLTQQFRLDHRLAFTLPLALTGALVTFTGASLGLPSSDCRTHHLCRTNKAFVHDDVKSRRRLAWTDRSGPALPGLRRGRRAGAVRDLAD